jgi:hypothetical protein
MVQTIPRNLTQEGTISSSHGGGKPLSAPLTELITPSFNSLPSLGFWGTALSLFLLLPLPGL